MILEGAALVVCSVLAAPSSVATANRSPSRSTAVTSVPWRANAYTRKAPIPPAPMTTACSSAAGRPAGRIVCTAIDIGCAIAATSPVRVALGESDTGARRDGGELGECAVAVRLIVK